MILPGLSFQTGFFVTLSGCILAALCFVLMLRDVRQAHTAGRSGALTRLGPFGRNILSAYRRLHPSSVVPNVYRLGVLLALLGLACAALSSPTTASA